MGNIAHPTGVSGGMMRQNWYLWVLPLAAALSYAVLVLWFGPQVQAAAGGLLPFDLRALGYRPDEARIFLATLTPEGRAVYLGPVRINDTVFPVLFTLTLCLPVRRWNWAWTLPALAYGLLDLAENLVVARMLQTGPEVGDGTIALASALTQAKFAAVVVGAVICLWGIWVAWRRG